MPGRNAVLCAAPPKTDGCGCFRGRDPRVSVHPMAQTDEREPHPSTKAVVRPLSRAGGRPCSRPGCPSPSRATLTFSYETREAWLGPLSETRTPEAYDLCSQHAARTRPPRGWGYADERPEEDVETSSGDLGDERTVAVLAAALRGEQTADDAEEDDALREALEELQAVALPLVADEELQDLRLVDPETRRRRREQAAAEAEGALPGDGIRSTVERARRAAGDLVPRGSTGGRDRAPGRQVPAAEERPDEDGPATLW